MSSMHTKPQNRLFHVVDRTSMSTRRAKMKNVRVKRVKLLFFYCQIGKIVNNFRSTQFNVFGK